MGGADSPRLGRDERSPEGEKGRRPAAGTDLPAEAAEPGLRAYEVPTPAGFEGARWLVGASPNAVLERIYEGDPLGLVPRCEAVLRERALLIDLNRLFLRAAARTAHEAVRYRGEHPLAEWLDLRIEKSVEDLLREDREAEYRGLPPTPEELDGYAMVTEGTGIEPGLARAVCDTFNSLSLPVRRAFYGAVYLARGITATAQEQGVSIGECEARIREALVAILSLGRAGEDEEQRGRS